MLSAGILLHIQLVLRTGSRLLSEQAFERCVKQLHLSHPLASLNPSATVTARHNIWEAPTTLLQMPGIFSKGISPIWWGYRTPREIIVSDVPTAVLYRALQLVVFAITISALVEKNTWAYSEAPDATANIWVESTANYTAQLQKDYSSCQASHSGPVQGQPAGGPGRPQRRPNTALLVAGSGRALPPSPSRA